MKKIFFIIICTTFYLNAAAQQLVNDEVMQLTLPKGTKQLAETQLAQLSHRGYDEKTARDFHGHIFKKNNLLFYYRYIKTPLILKKNLENVQKQMVYITKRMKYANFDTSKIITVNNIRFLIIEYHEDDFKYLWFSSDYDKNNEVINCFIEYKKPDEEDARQYMHDFLGNMHVK